MLLSIFSTLVLTFATLAKASVTSLALPGLGQNGLQGEVVGKGANGTTYVLSGSFTALTTPFTMTVVEDATHVVETAVLKSAEVLEVDCSLSGKNAVCTQKAIIQSSTSATTITSTIDFLRVSVSSGTPSRTSHSTTTSAASGSGSSTLPPSISASTTSTTSTTASSTSSGGAGGSGNTSDALQNARIAFGLALLAFLASLVDV
ncbi:uncharacterized protein FOMMEDRAFT_151730 [Fomitiporia mediterranea MF3/22]|uniref:uncharacterized protein n=1 Tax=Fomitiporia mediterranea (strain MF3/22) TaxID=694068 RepID=UPI00044099C9|nr:uncharacterized protein FOMMEDRAFT_151730 [Fomitiporia mediterranea MF3/22]EJD06462.1 hypothetical protein FOMMEDRAFT_151730 [Fomitiporia mediterranea MF3/22]